MTIEGVVEIFYLKENFWKFFILNVKSTFKSVYDKITPKANNQLQENQIKFEFK